LHLHSQTVWLGTSQKVDWTSSRLSQQLPEIGRTLLHLNSQAVGFETG